MPTSLPQYVRYMVRHLLLPTLLVTGSLTGIIWLTQALRFIDFIVNRGLNLGDFVMITSLLFPSLLMLLVPVSLFIAVLFTYYKLLADSELVVLRAAGLSNWQLAIPALIVAGGCTLFCYILSLYIMPLSNRQFEDMRSFLRNNYTSVLLQEEVFNTPVDGLTVFVRERDRDGNLKGILVHDNREASGSVTMMAEDGTLTQTAQGPRFLLKNGLRQEWKDGRVSWLDFDSYALDLSFYTNMQRKASYKENEQFLGELLRKDGTAKERAQRVAEFHQRLLWPLYNLALALIALAFLLCGEINRRGQWKRSAAAAVCTAGVVVVALGLRNLVVNTPSAMVAMYVLLLGSCLLAGQALNLGFLPRRKSQAEPA